MSSSDIIINSLLSTKYEIIYTEKTKDLRVLLKIKNKYADEIIEKLSLLRESNETWNYILPFTYEKS